LTVVVRRATPADLPALRQLHAACIAAADWLPDAAKLLDEHAALAPVETGLVAESATGQLLGFAATQPQARFLRNLFVAVSARGRGVGKALLAELPRLAAQPGPWQLKCIQLNRAALAFYAAQGWHSVGAGESSDGAWALLQSPGDSD
jgi:GNAT superfamily N-acetyltransferase